MPSTPNLQSSVKQQIEKLLAFLDPLLNLANSHMVDFFTRSSYVDSVPKDMQEEIARFGHRRVIDSIFRSDFERMPRLRKFVAANSEFTLKNSSLCLSTEDLVEKLRSWGCEEVEKFKLEIFMSAKKSHEVEILSAACAALTRVAGVTHVVDVGDGKGYLSSMLALRHRIPVLGVDASDVNTGGALRRAHKLSRVWRGLGAAPRKSHPAKHDDTSTQNVDFYKQATRFVDGSFDLGRLVADEFTVEAGSLRLGVVGLHTCGDLSPTSLKIFSRNSNVRLICNVGCCYHLLEEKSQTGGDEFGFPLSQYLVERKTAIGRSARMIANQSVDRIIEAKELPNITIYYRALLQVILERYCTQLPAKHVGKFKKSPESFLEYCRTAMKRIGVDVDISDAEIEEFHSLYKNRVDELNLFYLLRCRLAPVVESLILLDRLLFLYERGFEKSFLVQFFDPVVSPRCYGVVAIKE